MPSQIKDEAKGRVNMKTVSQESANSNLLNKPATPMPDKAVKVLASSIFRHLQSEGCQPKDIISVSSQLLSLVTSELQKDQNGGPIS
jgi:hypothetical protein